MAANVVEITVTSRNATAAGFDEAKAGAAGAGASMDGYAAAVDRAAVAQDRFYAAQTEVAAAQARVDELTAAETSGAAELAAAQDALTTATLASLDAQIRLGDAELRVSEAERAAGDAAASQAAKTDAAGGAMAGAGAKMKMAFLGVAVGTGLAVKSAADFDTQMTRLVTSAGESGSKKTLDMLRQGMLSLSASTATTTSEMASGMYTVESAGFHGASGLVVLKAAAQGAKDEGAQLSVVANAVTDVLVDFHMKASQAATATSQLVTAVSFGKTNFEEFSSSMANVLPLASAMHLKLSDVTGVLAEMTAHGMSAQRASEDEANAMRSLMAPTGEMVKEFGALGISSAEVERKLSTVGLAGTMQWLSGVAHKGAGAIGQNYTEAMKKLMGTAPGLVTALMTTGKNANETNKAIAGIGKASADSSGNVDGFSKVSQTLNFKLDAAKNAITAAGISLGSALLPAVTAVMGPVASFGEMIAKNKDLSIGLAVVVGGVLAGALGGKLVNAFKDVKSGIEGAGQGITWLLTKLGLMTAAQEAQTVATEEGAVAQGEMDVAMDANPIGLIILAIVALIAVIVLVVTHFKTLKKWAGEAFHFVANLAKEAVDFVKEHWKLILAILTGPIGLAVLFIVDHWKQITSGAAHMISDVIGFFTRLPGDILHAVGDLGKLLWDAGVKVVEGLIGGITSMIGSAGHAIGGVVHEIASFLPFSPAKKGPLSGAGDPRLAGGRIASTLAGGMDAGGGVVAAAAGRLAGRAAPGPGGAPAGGGYGGPGGGAVQLEIVSGGGGMFENFMTQFLRDFVRVKGGGNVQKAFGWA